MSADDAGSTGAASRPVRVAVVDDHPVVREGTAALLADPGVRRDRPRRDRRRRPDVALSGHVDVLVSTCASDRTAGSGS